MESAGSLKSCFLNDIHFVNQKRNVRTNCSMLTIFLGWTPLAESSFFTQGCCSWAHFAWFRPRRVGKQQFYWKKSIGKFGSLSLGFQILIASSDKKELVARCSMLTALCPTIHGENGVSFKISRVHGISARRLALCETKTITFTQGRPCWNRRLGFPRFFSEIVVPPFLVTKLWFKGGHPFWDPESFFWLGASYWNWSVLNGWVFLGKLSAVVDRKNCLHFVVVQNVPC